MVCGAALPSPLPGLSCALLQPSVGAGTASSDRAGDTARALWFLVDVRWWPGACGFPVEPGPGPFPRAALRTKLVPLPETELGPDRSRATSRGPRCAPRGLSASPQTQQQTADSPSQPQKRQG